MKRLLVCVMVLLMMAAPCLAEISVTAADDAPVTLEDLGVSDLEVTWVEGPVAYRCVLTWQADGCDYEAAIMGLDEKLDDDQLVTLLGAWRNRTHAAITGDVVDAEKQSNRLSWQTGTWLVTDTEDRPEYWGDASMCWAATASNMLWSSGWAQQAVNPLTGNPFASEDEVFTLFIRHFLDTGGGWSDHGVRWFFTGSGDMLDLKERYPLTEHTSIDGYDVLTYQYGTTNNEYPTATEPATMAEFVSVIRRMKDGAAVGTSVGFNQERWYLPESPDEAVIWSQEKKCFMMDVVSQAEKSDCLYGPYCFNEVGDPLPLTERDGAYYVEETGAEVDAAAVLLGYLYPAEGQWWVTEEFGDERNVLLLVEKEIPEELVLQGRMEQTSYATHSHALTVTGYVINLSAEDPGDMVEALFIANSDNDAAIWHITADTLPREQRPNVYDMYPVSVHSSEDGAEQRTLCLEQFMDHTLTLVNNFVALDPYQE